MRAGIFFALLALPGIAQDPPGKRTTTGARPPAELGTEHWAITSSLGAVPGKDFYPLLEALYQAWQAKAGPAAGAPSKLNLTLHFDRDSYNQLPDRSGWYTLEADRIHLLCDPTYAQSLAAGGPKLYLRQAYPKLAARKDVPPWVFSGLVQYLACASWNEGKVEQDNLKLPLNSQSLLSFQGVLKSSDWSPMEKTFRAEGRDYEIRKRVIDLQAWAFYYYLFNSPGTEGGRGKHAGSVGSLLAQLEEGKKLDEALAPLLKTVAGGTLVHMEKAIKDYLQKVKVDVKDREEGDWLVGETAHYTIRVQKGAANKKTRAVDKQILEELKWKMELMFDKYALAFRFQGLLPGKASLRLFKNKQNYLGSGAPPTSAAYYNSGTKELVGYEDSEETGIYFNILCHEGCHQFFDLAFPGFYEGDSIPMWFSEGLADCFGASEIRGRDVYVFTLGGVAAWRVESIKQFLQEGRTPPIKELLSMSRAPFMSGAQMHYPQSWSFVHFLWNYPSLDQGKGTYSEIVIRLIDGFKVGKPRDEVYKEAFQIKGKPVDLDELEKAWKGYVKTLRVRK